VNPPLAPNRGRPTAPSPPPSPSEASFTVLCCMWTPPLPGSKPRRACRPCAAVGYHRHRTARPRPHLHLLLPLELCLELFVTTAPLLLRRYATAPRTDGCSGHTGRASPPVPTGNVPSLCTTPRQLVKVQIDPRAAHRRAPANGPPAANSSRRQGPNCVDCNISRM
jgi:hypothetical protein